MRFVLLFGLGVFLSFISNPAGSLPAPYAPGHMPVNLAAYALAPEPDYAQAKLATLRVRMPHGVCSGTAVDHHRVLTAKHCIRDGITGGFRLGGRTAVITAVAEDDHDAVLLTTDIYFEHIARFGPKPLQGDIVFSHGNPDSTPDMLLIGRVAGWASFMGVDDVMLLDRNDWYGCSGAAVFDHDGRIVGIVNSIFPWPNDGWRLTASYPITFTAAQLALMPPQ